MEGHGKPRPVVTHSIKEEAVYYTQIIAGVNVSHEDK